MSKRPRLIPMKVVQELTSLSRTHIGRLEADGKFPKRIRLSNHPRGRVAWPEDAVHDWIEKRMREVPV